MLVSGRVRQVAILALATLAALAACSAPSDEALEPEPAEFGGKMEGEGSVDVHVHGLIATLSAAASEGWRFDHWDGPNDTSTENPHNVSAARVGDYTAWFVQQLELTVSIEGDGVVKISGGDSVGPAPLMVDRDSEWALIAVDTNGWCFDHWDGDVAGTNGSMTVVIDENKAIEAVFVPQYELVVSIEGEGSVEVDGADAAGGAPILICEGAEQTLTAVSSNGWRFDRWSGDVVGTNGSIAVTIDGNKTLTAEFVQQFELTVSITGEGSVEIDGVGPVGAAPVTVDKDSAQILTAVATNGWHFDRWDGDALGTDNPITVTMGEDKAIEAVFVAEPTLTVRILSESGDEFISSNGIYEPGTVVSIDAHIPDGWEFDRWLVSDGTTAPIADPTSPSTTVTVSRDMMVTGIAIDRTRSNTLEILSDTGAEGVPFVEGATAVTLAANIADCDFRLTFSPRGYFLACWSDLEDRPEAEHAAYGGIPVRNTFFHGEAVVLSACSYVIQAGEATFSGQTAVSSWDGDASSSTDTVTVIMDGDKTVNAIR